MMELRAPDIYLARYAGAMFWLGRYLERAENLARLLDVIHTFTPAARGEQNWQAVLAIHRDEQAFAERYPGLAGGNVIRFYVSDASQPNSIASCVRMARHNASAVRATISTEMWVQINVMHNFLRSLEGQALSLPELPALLSKIRRQCQAHAGIMENGLYRGQGWYFYGLGKHIERADQITRLLDIKYHLLLPSADAVGSLIDVSQWFLLLRAAGAYHTFRRENHGLISPAMVAQFLLKDARFPRSVAHCVHSLRAGLQEMEREFGLAGLQGAMARAESLRVRLASDSIDHIIAGGLHEYLDSLQLDFIAIAEAIAAESF